MANKDMKGLLIDFEYCSGCHACEVACKKEHDYAKGQRGIHVLQVGPNKKPNSKWEFDFVPVVGDLCDLCTDRVGRGKKPTCVHHCQAMIIQFGTVDELAEKIDKQKMSLFVPPNQE